jgi:hypothetical protein
MAEPVLKSDGTRYAYMDLVLAPRAVHGRILREGSAPAFEDLAGWEFDGINTRPVAALLGIRKFIKGFYEGPPRVAGGPAPFIQGYNIPVRANGLWGEHIPKPSPEHPRRQDFFRVYRVVAGARHSRYPNAVLLDYSLGGTRWVPSTPLRDYLVQVYPDDRDLLLGVAYYDLGYPWYLSRFVLRRRAPHTFSG